VPKPEKEIPLTEVRWEVRLIKDPYYGGWFWRSSGKGSGLRDDFPKRLYKSKTAAKQAWQRFAGRNHFLTFKFVE